MTETRVCHVNDRIDGAVYIGRANGRRRLSAHTFANPYSIKGEITRSDSLFLYRKWLLNLLRLPETGFAEQLIALRNAPALACWCRHEGETVTPGNECHGDIILNTLAQFTDKELRAMGGSS